MASRPSFPDSPLRNSWLSTIRSVRQPLILCRLTPTDTLMGSNGYKGDSGVFDRFIQMQQQKKEAGTGSAIRQGLAIMRKNLHNHLSNKKRLLGELMLPLIVSAAYVGTQEAQKSNPMLAVLLQTLLKMYLGLLGSSAVKEVVTLFITERTEHFRQYQMIFGVSQRTHTLANLLYICLFMSLFISPVFFTLIYYHFDPALIFRFAAFVSSTCTLALAMTAFFRDHKIAVEAIGLFFSLAAFLPFMYDKQAGHSALNLLIMALPNSSFALAILENSSTPSFFSFALIKVYMLVFSIVEFPEYYVSVCRSCCWKLAQWVPVLDRRPTNLMEEFQLNEVVASELEPRVQRQAAVRTEALGKSYKVKGCAVNALSSVSLTIYQSQIFGLLGRNGAGKTTLVDILTGVTQPSSGSYHLASPSVGICYQHEVLYEELTVDQHLQLYAGIKQSVPPGETLQEHIDQVVKTLGIEAEREKKAKELSGGNKRKLSIAIAILGRPGLLIFDEPTSGLDPLSRINVWEVFTSLRRTRSTIILTTHHLDQAERLTDWICVIEKGQLIVQNTAAQIKQRYGKGFHLEVALNAVPLSYAHIDKYKSIIERAGLRAIELEHLPSQANFLVKPLQKEGLAVEFERAFVEVVAELELEEAAEARFHSNTLEESFIAILKDEENSSGDSLSEQPLTRDAHRAEEVGLRWLKQLIGVMLKNLLYNKSIFTQALLLYNINILIILIYGFFTNIFKDAVPTDAQAPSNNSANPMMLLQGYSIMAAAFISLPVYEKEKRIKGVLNARGVSWGTYWLGHFLFDYAAYWLNLLVMGYLVAAEEVGKVGWVALGRLGVGVILFSYCSSHLFQKVKTASVWFGVINIMLNMLVLPLILMGKTRVPFLVECFKLLYPFYDLTLSALLLQLGDQQAAILELAGIDLAKPDGSAIISCIIFYFCLLLCLEIRPWLRLRAYCTDKHHKQSIAEQIRLDQVSLRFGDVQALSQVSYYASEERLALLGHNGAGKSTTFGLLSAQLTADSGDVFLEGERRLPWERQLRSGGICYQEDALWEGVLVQEVLTIVSWLVPVGNPQRETKWLWQSLEFDSNNAFKRVSNLSGGNKRKLCMMFALFGDPNIRLLDECSTGLDPASRLAMVDTLKASRTGTTVFTTHSMSEAEDLCTKAVIMGKGRVLQFDFIGKMRSRHFDCCWVHLHLRAQGESKAAEQLVRQGIVLESQEGVQVKLRVDKKTVRKSDLLRQLIALKEARDILNFSWVEPRLEDVYLKVTREQGEQAEPSAQDNTEEI